MLVLSRKVGESFVIGDKITVTVVRVTGNGVRIGIEAPGGHDVLREELRKLTGEGEGIEDNPIESDSREPLS